MAPDVERLLTSHGIFPPSYEPYRYYLTCPQCSAGRKPKHQKLKCLSLMIEPDRAYWKCHHCGWTGPAAGSNSQPDDRPRYEYPGGNWKTRNPKGRSPPYVWEHEDEYGHIVTGAHNLGAALYRLEEAIAHGGLIAVVEGEKDADNLWRHGFPAITSAHGAAQPGQRPKWTAEHSRQLAGLDLVVLNDNDPAGYEHAKAVVDCSHGIAKSIRRLDLKNHWPDIPASGDISDFLEHLYGADYPGDEWVRDLLEDAPLINGKAGPAPPLPPLETYADLKGAQFMPLQWIVPTYIPEGVTLLAGKPKIGKSWLALAITMACADGAIVLDQRCEKRGVIYFALEDNRRRMQARTEKLLGLNQEWPTNTGAAYDLPLMDKGCIETLQQYANGYPTIGLMIIDTLAKVRGPKRKDEDQYAADHRTMSALLDFSHRTGIAIIVIHHVRKQDAGDIFDTISGTLGLNGGADTLLVLTKAGDQLRLAVRGRDLEEQDKTLFFDPDLGAWGVTGDYEPEDTSISGNRALILSALTVAGSAGMSPDDIAKKTGLNASTVRGALRRMALAGKVVKTQYGSYTTVSR
jgi:hypothetical protein